MDDAGVSLQATMADMGRAAREGARALRLASPEQRTAAIRAMAAEIRKAAPAILAANAEDLARAEANGVSGPMLDRLALDAARLEGVAAGVEAVADIPDPLGVATSRWTRPNGLDISRVRTPIGVIAMIYESRPNVTADAAALCVRSGNAVILRGGSECIASNLAIHAAIERGLEAAGLPVSAVQAVKTPDRAAVGMILQGLDRSIDLIIPRGGKSLVARVQAEARAPVLGHLEGLNHVFVHAAADVKKATDIVVNAKLRRVSVCGAAETLLVDKAAAASLLPPIAEALVAAGCELRLPADSVMSVPAGTLTVQAPALRVVAREAGAAGRIVKGATGVYDLALAAAETGPEA